MVMFKQSCKILGVFLSNPVPRIIPTVVVVVVAVDLVYPPERLHE